MTEKKLRLDKITIDGGTQPRVEIDQALVNEYFIEFTENMAKFPPLIVYSDGVHYWLVDGFHRYHAYMRANVVDVECVVHTGTRRDAVKHSLGVNHDHGQRRTNDDKRKAVFIMLDDLEWQSASDRTIAETCRVSPGLVATCRSESESADKGKVRKGKDGRTIDTEKIGKSRKKKPPVSDPGAETVRDKGEAEETPSTPLDGDERSILGRVAKGLVNLTLTEQAIRLTGDIIRLSNTLQNLGLIVTNDDSEPIFRRMVKALAGTDEIDHVILETRLSAVYGASEAILMLIEEGKGA